MEKMKNEKILIKARKVLSNNKYYQEAVKSHNEIAKKLTHWGQAESVERIIFICGDDIVMSNEGSVILTEYNYNSCLESSLDKEFKKAGLFVEAYDGGTFHISWEGF